MISLRKFYAVMAFGVTNVVVATACTGPSVPTLGPDEEDIRTGSLEVTTVTSGQNIDPNGYLISLDEQRSETVDSNGGAFFTELREGPWEVALADLAQNCDLATGMNPRTIEVSEGQTTGTSFIITCS